MYKILLALSLWIWGVGCQQKKGSDATTDVVSKEKSQTEAAAEKPTDELTRQKGLGGVVSILMPKDFKALPEADRKAKFPAKEDPQDVWTNPDGNAQIAFLAINEAISASDFDAFLKEMTGEIKKGGNKVSELEVKEANGLKLGILEFEAPEASGGAYSIMTATLIKGKVVTYTFACALSEKSKWVSIAKKIALSAEAG